MPKSKQSKMRAGKLRDVFQSGSAEQIHEHIARLAVLYEDLRIEMYAIAADDIPALDQLDQRYRRLYFVRRSIATLEECSDALVNVDQCPSFNRIKSRPKGKGGNWDLWDAAIVFFRQNRDFIKKVRNDIGGHFGRTASRHALQHLEPTATGIIEVAADQQGKGADVKLHFAGEIAATATLRHLEGSDVSDRLLKLIETTKEGYGHATKAVQTLAAHYLFERFGR